MWYGRGVVRRAIAVSLTLFFACESEREPLDASVRPDVGFVDSGVVEDSGVAPDSGDETVEITFRARVPSMTPAGSTIHIAGNFQGWDPASPQHRLTEVEAGLFQIALSFDRGQMLEFKFTRGSWETVEKGATGQEISNRTLTAGATQTVELTVASWADSMGGQNTITGDVRTTTVTGFLSGRRVWIYLPPSYSISTVSYPVLYMLDGQNVFDRFTSFSGEWQVDETLERLIPAEEVEPLIVVAIDNSAQRISEYTPWADGEFGGGMGAAHLEAITSVLIPWVNSHYRTLTGPENTGISGSSLGGLFTLYATYTRPDIFGRNAALSPSIWWADREVLDFAAAAQKPNARVWMDMGTQESTDAITELRLMRDLMLNQGFVIGTDLQVVEDPGAGHNEAAWARRFPDVLRFLFPKR